MKHLVNYADVLISLLSIVHGNVLSERSDNIFYFLFLSFFTCQGNSPGSASTPPMILLWKVERAREEEMEMKERSRNSRVLTHIFEPTDPSQLLIFLFFIGKIEIKETSYKNLRALIVY